MKNIRTENALARITLGILLLLYVGKKPSRSWSSATMLIALAGSMKVAEGLLRYCPVVALYDKFMPQMKKPLFSNHKTTLSHTEIELGE